MSISNRLFLQSSLLVLFISFSLSSAHNKSHDEVVSSPPPSQPSANYSGCFSKVYAFGDSSTDNGNSYMLGNLQFLHSSSSSGGGGGVGSYSKSFHLSSSGDLPGHRLTNGRFIVDYVTQGLGVTTLTPYKSIDKEYSIGAGDNGSGGVGAGSGGGAGAGGGSGGGGGGGDVGNGFGGGGGVGGGGGGGGGGSTGNGSGIDSGVGVGGGGGGGGGSTSSGSGTNGIAVGGGGGGGGANSGSKGGGSSDNGGVGADGDNSVGDSGGTNVGGEGSWSYSKSFHNSFGGGGGGGSYGGGSQDWSSFGSGGAGGDINKEWSFSKSFEGSKGGGSGSGGSFDKQWSFSNSFDGSKGDGGSGGFNKELSYSKPFDGSEGGGSGGGKWSYSDSFHGSIGGGGGSRHSSSDRHLTFLPKSFHGNWEVHGSVNFAIAGATSLSKEDFVHKQVRRSYMWGKRPVTYEKQVDWFNTLYAAKSRRNGERACQADMAETLFWIGGIGSSDYHRMYGSGSAIKSEKLNKLAILHTTKILKTLVAKGAKYIIVQGLPPMGCFPSQLSRSSQSDCDKLGCSAKANAVIITHNTLLQQRLEYFRHKYPDCVISYADTYGAYQTILTNYKSYHFEEPFKVCCGAQGSGSYNFDPNKMCGSTGSSTCKDSSKYISWDGYHFTDAMNAQLADLFINKGYCQPSFHDILRAKKCI